MIVPAYNEVENIPELVAELRAAFERFDMDGEVVLVDDGSTDGTAERAGPGAPRRAGGRRAGPPRPP
ncbi:MAG: glycosyltransferase, partial [Gemmatimonadetes bacterium]|nr:glycosyltransferase [Gemmatimonadota bacterium]